METIMYGHKSIRGTPRSFIYLWADPAIVSLSVIVDSGISCDLIPPRYPIILNFTILSKAKCALDFRSSYYLFWKKKSSTSEHKITIGNDIIINNKSYKISYCSAIMRSILTDITVDFLLQLYTRIWAQKIRIFPADSRLMRAQRQRNHWFRTASRRKARAAISYTNDGKIPFKNIVCLSLIGSRITTGTRENKLMRQALRPNRVFSTLSLGCIFGCGSMSIFTEVYQWEKKKEREKERKRASKKRMRRSCWSWSLLQG